MSAPRKLVGFAALLLLVFGAAIAAGEVIGPEREGRASSARDPHGDSGAGEDAGLGHGGAAAAADPVRGLAVSEGGLTLDVEETRLRRARETELRFRIVGSGGEPVRDFELEHEQRMHVIVVRRDGHGFQHLHPRLARGGVWSVRLTLIEAGAYRIFADFDHGGSARTLAADLSVDGEADYRPLPASATTARTDAGYDVRLDTAALRAGREAELRFGVSRDGEAIRTQPYLGAAGHLVALREGDLAYLHVHPEGQGEAVSFTTEFPSEGRYRLYLQFKHGGRVHVSEFTQEVGA